MVPMRVRMSRVRDASRTCPLALNMGMMEPSAVAMPVESWPRCCSRDRASYTCWLTGLDETIPTMPHMLRAAPGVRGRAHRIEVRLILAYAPVGFRMRAPPARDDPRRVGGQITLFPFGGLPTASIG